MIHTPLRTELEIEQAITHRDLDYELWRARRYVFMPDHGRIRALPVVAGASGITGTWGELIYSNPLVGTAKNTFTTEFAINDTAGMGPLMTLPAEFFTPGNMRGKTLRVVARGVQLGTASTPPTWLWTFRFNPTLTPAVPPTGPIIAGGIAAVTGTTTANTLWEAEFDLQFTLEAAAGNNSTLRGLGFLTSPRGLVSPFGMDLFGGAASPGTVATFDWSVQNTLTVGITCGTSLAANQMQLLDLLVFGLN
jgi:hypothetical protein